jgi:hypothetical protein
MSALRTAAWLLVAGVLGGCGSRPSYWDTPVTGTANSYGLANGVALVDDADHRVVMLTALGDQQLARRAFPVGHHVVSTVTSPDRRHLFVLSTGDWPRRKITDEAPSLTVIGFDDPKSFDPKSTRYDMTVPLPNLAVDPAGQWAVAYAGSGAPQSFVENANELVIFNLSVRDSKPTARNIRSFGGTPQRLTFTPKLQLPRAQARLLIIETDIDVTFLNLDNPTPSTEVTVPLTSGTGAQPVNPAGVVVDAFDSTNPADARVALRAADNRNVFTFTLGGSPSDVVDFRPAINVIDVGGVPSDIAFVRTGDRGLRLAALVPTISSAVLVDPDSSVTTQVTLPAPYSKLSLVTDVVGSSPLTDVAMLWNASTRSASGVAFWDLRNTVDQPYFSIEPVTVSRPIQAVDDVTNNEKLKVLETADNTTGFFVLDLAQRTASPLQTVSRASLAIAPDGQRLWAFAQGGTDLAKLDFATLNPVPVKTEPPIDAVHDVARADGASRSLIAIHAGGTLGATVFDAVNPDTATSRRVSALLLEGP